MREVFGLTKVGVAVPLTLDYRFRFMSREITQEFGRRFVDLDQCVPGRAGLKLAKFGASE